MDRSTTPISTPSSPCSESSDIFKHAPLPDPSAEIRLICLQSTSTAAGSHISCSLRSWPLISVSAYAAVSYTWGSDTQKRAVIVNGKPKHVNVNCYYVLEQLMARSSDSWKYFWIDSICIDQDNLVEKSEQVQIMCEIYRRAQVVLACIGSHAKGSATVMEVMEHLDRDDLVTNPNREDDARSIEVVEENQQHVRNVVHSVFASNQPDLSPQAACDHFAEAYVKLARRPYWERMWIIQELWHAKVVLILCGDSTLPLSAMAKWKDPCRAVVGDHSIEGYGASEAFQLAGMDIILDWLYRPKVLKEKRLRPLLALQNFYPWKCGNFRDRVYALLGLTSWGEHAPKPDYALNKVSWALQIFECLAFVENSEQMLAQVLESLVERIGLTLPDEEAQSLLQRRRDAVDSEVIGLSTPPASNLRRMFWQRTSATTPNASRLYRLPDGTLSANLSQRGPPRPVAMPETPCQYQQLFVDGVPEGYICAAAADGDYLLRLSYPANFYIVVRELEAGKFSMLGYAILSTFHSMGRKNDDAADALSLNVHFDPEDALTWAVLFNAARTHYDDASIIREIVMQPAARCWGPSWAVAGELFL